MKEPAASARRPGREGETGALLALPITLGVSTCLLGERVRYDGGHKHDRFITEVLGHWCRLVPICPEVGCGLPVPREPIRLEGDPANPRFMTVSTRIDLTDPMLAFCKAEVERLAGEELSGFIFKANSPSCGLLRVPVYRDDVSEGRGSGFFAAAMGRHFPFLPLEEEGRLQDQSLRENFIERVISYRRWRGFLAADPDPGRLVTFHTAHKLLMMAHSPEMYVSLGRLVSQGQELPLPELLRRYEALFMTGMARLATPRKQTDVLQHMMGYFKQQLSPAEKEELLEAIGRYHDLLTPLSVPMTLIRQHTRTFDQPYLRGQVYLWPHPLELYLQNRSEQHEPSVSQRTAPPSPL